jgi:hypothetical protein
VQLRSLARRSARRPSFSARAVADAYWDEARAGLALAALSSLGPVGGAVAAEREAACWLRGELRLAGCTNSWDGNWRPASGTPLWNYHLQYHDVLADLAWHYSRTNSAEAADSLRSAIDGWLDEWEAGGSPAWDPYPLAVRCVNWLRILAWSGAAIGATRQRMIRSLASQLDVLSRNLEWHLLGNHVLREAWALAIAGTPFGGEWGASVTHRGMAVFGSQLLAQIGPDGIHEERTPMYQARVVRDALEVLAVSRAIGDPAPRRVAERIRAASEALVWLRRPDGTLFLLNDAANDHGVDLDQLSLIAERVCGARMKRREGVRFFQQGTIAVISDSTAGDKLLADLGAPAPEHQPGHAHAGALGFELDLSGTPVLVDSGCSGYAGEPLRSYQRSTRAHNTIAIDGRDQSEMWDTFRVARRAELTGATASGTSSDATLTGKCVPYFDRTASHERTIRRIGRTVEVTDRVVGAKGRRLESHLHFHPDWTPSIEGEEVTLAGKGRGTVTVRARGADLLSLHRGEADPPLGWYAPAFGTTLPCWTLRMVVERNAGNVISYTVIPS